MNRIHWTIAGLLSIILLILSSFVHTNSICCMFSATRSFGFPGQFILIHKETNIWEEAQKVNTLSTKELLKQGWQIQLGASVNSPISQHALLNIVVNYLSYFLMSLTIVYLMHKKKV